MPDKIEISTEDAIEIVANWRGANEAPGGQTSHQAIKNMGDAVYNIALVLRENGYNI